MVLSPLNLVGTETTESLSRGAGAVVVAACAMGAIRMGRGGIRIGRGGGVGCLGGVRTSGKGNGSSGSSTGSNRCNLR